MAGPLFGLRVVDCSRSTAGWRLTQLLADYGAEVLWVEPPGGDPLRHERPIDHAVFNRGKRNLSLDVTSDAGRAQLLGVVSESDLFVATGRRSDLDALGLGWNELHSIAPAVVYCTIGGFGVGDPHEYLPDYEALVHAVVGTTGEQVGLRDGPIFEGLPFASIGAAYLAGAGALAALYRRGIDGRGRLVETSLLDGALAYLMLTWGDSDRGAAMQMPGASRLVARTFECGDGAFLGVHTGAVGAFDRLMEVLGLLDSFAVASGGAGMGAALTPAQVELMHDELPRRFAARPRSEWLERLRAADVCAVEVMYPTEAFDTPQVRHNEMVVTVDDPVLGPVQQVGPPIKFARTPASASRPAPPVAASSAEPMWSERVEPQEGHAAQTTLLDGVRILDLGAYYAGPYSSRLLADLGADVIKLEPVAGDPLRGLSVVYRSAQAGKRSIAANLKDPDLAGLRDHLLRWADVVHHNMRPGAAERLGLGYEDVRAVRENIVYLYAPGWGSTGPDHLRQSFAPKMSGYVGAAFEVAGQFNPPLFPAGNEDPGNGLVGAIGILMALLHRQRTGEGQYVENPQLNATLAHVSHIVRRPGGEVLGAGRLDSQQYGFSAFERLYRTSDGWMCLAVLAEHERRALGALIPGLFDPPVDMVTAKTRRMHDALLSERLESALATEPTQVWLDRCAAAGVPAVAPKTVRNSLEFLRDGQQQALGRVAAVPHERDAMVREIDQLIRVSEAVVPVHRVAVDLGAHTTEILRHAGYDDEQIEALQARHTVR